MPSKVRMYGRKSLARAQAYVAQYPNRDLVILKENRTRRFAVCSTTVADKLRSQGFSPVEDGN